MDINRALNEVANEEFTYSDPSDYSAEEAERIVQGEQRQGRTDQANRQAETMMLEKPWTAKELLDAVLNDEYIIRGCLVRGQPAIIAGASKTLKTTLAIFLLLALTSGKPFLGRFKVNARKRVFFATAESGKATVQKTIRAVAAVMGITDEELNQIAADKILVNWWVPRISNNIMLETFTTWVDDAQADVCIIDPLYQTLDDAQSSVVLNGQQLAVLSRHIELIGATPVMIDHVKRSSQNAKDFQPLELEDVTGAGKAEFFRQWMLLSRRSKFEPSEAGIPLSHDLWLSVGGSAGHASTWALDVSEKNIQDENGNLSNREYEVEINPRSKAIEQQKAQQVDRQAERQAKKDAEKLATFNNRVDRVRRKMKTKPNEPMTKTDIRALLQCNGDIANEVLYALESDKEIIKMGEPVKRGRNNCEAWLLAGELALEVQSDAGHVVQNPSEYSVSDVGTRPE